ncbi:SUMF1/EgtB/PvdO family nonheme iron enzyme [bacterium]|nr:SUMF1/EgtB/PvdO family nonheme iron enzyme [bacterium]
MLLARLPLALLGCVLLSLCVAAGCGSGGGSVQIAPPPPPPVAPKPVAVAVVDNKRPAVQPPAPQPQGDDQPARPAEIVNQYPNEPIDNVFLTAGPEESTVTEAPAVASLDQFVVSYGNPAVDSNTFQTLPGGQVGTEAAASTIRLPSGFQADPTYGYSPDGYPLRIVCLQDGKLMTYIPAGSVRVGSNTGPDETRPQFVAFHDPFYMDLTEVTVAQFELYRQSLRDQKKRVPSAPLNAGQPANFPALGVPWGDASTYVRWAGKELPTEAEFEKAARGTDGFDHPWGNGRPVWPRPRTPATLSAVGQFPGDVGPFGNYDLAGNAREWLADWYSPQAHQEAARTAMQKTLSNWSGPRKAAQGSQRVIKGSGPQWEVYYRWGSDMFERHPDVGFRGVLRISPEAATAAGS